MTGKITFTIAPARAGKSTFVRSWLKGVYPDGLNRVSLCRDDFRLSVYGERFNASREKEMHKAFDVALRALHQTGLYNIMLDETNTTIKSIRNIFKLDIEAIPYFIDTDIKTCKERAYASGQDDLVNKGVIDRMFNNLAMLCNYIPSLYSIDYHNEITEDLVYKAIEVIREEVRLTNISLPQVGD